MDDRRVNVPEGQVGSWAVQRFTVPENDWRAMTYALHGRPVDPGTYTRLIRVGPGWHDSMMSDTPAEIRDHLWAIGEIRSRGGRVLLNGLGLGMILKAALACENVQHVDVVEIDQDIIDLVWPTYAGDPRAQVHHADAYEIGWPKDASWTVAWHDIWPALCTDNLPEMAKLHRRYGRRVDWQGSWGKEWLQDMRRRERASGWG